MRKGQKTSPETRLKMSLASKGKKKNYKVWNKDKKGIYSEETLAKIRAGRAKQVFTTESKYKMGSSRRGKKDNAEMREKNRQGQYKRFERDFPGYSREEVAGRHRRKTRLIKNGGFHSNGEW
jgi:hypothetical protein